MSRSDFSGFVSAIAIVIVHMLKWDRQPDMRGPGWAASIGEHRRRMERSMRRHPSLKARKVEAVALAYDKARSLAADEMMVEKGTLPQTCPYDWDALISRAHDAPVRKRRNG